MGRESNWDKGIANKPLQRTGRRGRFSEGLRPSRRPAAELGRSESDTPEKSLCRGGRGCSAATPEQTGKTTFPTCIDLVPAKLSARVYLHEIATGSESVPWGTDSRRWLCGDPDHAFLGSIPAPLIDGQAISVPSTGNGLSLSLEWQDEVYVNPIDQKAYIAPGGWKTYQPGSSRETEAQDRNVKMEHVRLLTAETDVASRTTTEDLAVFCKAVDAAPNSRLAGVRVLSRYWCSSDARQPDTRSKWLTRAMQRLSSSRPSLILWLHFLIYLSGRKTLPSKFRLQSRRHWRSCKTLQMARGELTANESKFRGRKGVGSRIERKPDRTRVLSICEGQLRKIEIRPSGCSPGQGTAEAAVRWLLRILARGRLANFAAVRDNPWRGGPAMPLHDWKDEQGWDGVHLLWLSELVRWLRPRLPDDFRVYVGSVPALTVESTNGSPDLQVRRWQPEPPDPAQETALSLLEPDLEGVATFTFDPHRAIHIDHHGCLVAAIELVSPCNKDAERPKRVTPPVTWVICGKECICCWSICFLALSVFRFSTFCGPRWGWRSQTRQPRSL